MDKRRLGLWLCACIALAGHSPCDGAAQRAETPDSGSIGAVLNVDLSGNDPDLAASVPDIALDPRDPLHVVVVWRTTAMTIEPGTSSRRFVCHLSISRDGGSSFSDETIDWNMPDTPQCNAPYADFAANGDLYIGATLSGLGPINPPPGFHAFGRAVIRKSSDGGRTWSAAASVIASDSLTRFVPNASIPEAAKHTPWDGARGVVDRSTGSIYVSGGYPAPPGDAEHSQRFYSVSRDGGATWGDIRAMGSVEWPQRWDGRIVAAHGMMALTYVAAAAPGVKDCLCVVFATSDDAGITLQRKLVAQVSHVDALVHYPPLAADAYRRGRYAIALTSDDRTKLRLLTSFDDGAIWMETGEFQMPAGVIQVSRPAVTFTPDGALVAMWRGYHADGSYDVYMAAAAPGRNFGNSVRVTTLSSRTPRRLIADYAVRGDFINVVKAGPHFVHAAWTDWRTGTQARVVYGRVPFTLLLDPTPPG